MIEKRLKINEMSTVSKIFVNLVFMAYTAICIIPLLLVIIVSISDEKWVNINGYSFFPQQLSFESYKYVFSDSDLIIRSYGVSIFVTIVGSVLSLVIIALFAYPLSRDNFRLKKQMNFYVFFTMLFNGGIVPWYLVCTQVLHLKNNIWALIVPYLVNAWYIIILKTFYKTNLPDAVLESAKIDGASESRTFISIVIPLSIPGLATIALFNMLIYWNDFFLPLMLIDDDKWINLQYLMYRVQQNIQQLALLARTGGKAHAGVRIPSQTARMAMCVLAVGPIVFAYPFVQKYFIKGLTIGAVKG